MSSSADNEFFSDGITEEIINALAKIDNLKVTSRTSSFYFKGKNIPIREIGGKLQVAAILEGSVRVAGDDMRITAQLIQAEDDYHFWSETWNRKLDNIFQVQEEISLAIADKLREHVGHFPIQENLFLPKTKNKEVYAKALKAKFLKNKWNPEDMRKSIALYEEALALDPNHTTSLVGLADAYSFMAMIGFMPFDQAWKQSSDLIEKALAIDPNIPEAYYQLANHAFFTNCSFSLSFEYAVKTIAIGPNYVEGQQFIAFLYIVSGEFDKAKKYLDHALDIDPLSQETWFYLAYFSYMTEDFEMAKKQLETCLSFNAKNIPAHSVMTLCLLQLGQYDEVIQYFDNIPSDVIVSDEKLGSIALAHAYKNDAKNTELHFQKLLERAQQPGGFAADSYLYLMYAVMGKTDEAFNWVESKIKNPTPNLMMLRYGDPIAKPLRSDPRFAIYHQTIFDKAVVIEAKSEKKALLDEETTENLTERLLSYFEEEKPYLDTDLSLRNLAEKLDIHPNQLSWLLNTSLGKNFNDFVNEYRLQVFQDIAGSSEFKHLTIEGLAYESGFNSKTVFNTYFKKKLGMTPKQFLTSK